jgi:hypothetical protein
MPVSVYNIAAFVFPGTFFSFCKGLRLLEGFVCLLVGILIGLFFTASGIQLLLAYRAVGVFYFCKIKPCILDVPLEVSQVFLVSYNAPVKIIKAGNLPVQGFFSRPQVLRCFPVILPGYPLRYKLFRVIPGGWVKIFIVLFQPVQFIKSCPVLLLQVLNLPVQLLFPVFTKVKLYLHCCQCLLKPHQFGFSGIFLLELQTVFLKGFPKIAELNQVLVCLAFFGTPTLQLILNAPFLFLCGLQIITHPLESVFCIFKPLLPLFSSLVVVCQQIGQHSRGMPELLVSTLFSLPLLCKLFQLLAQLK